jgi:hypothetical protein
VRALTLARAASCTADSGQAGLANISVSRATSLFTEESLDTTGVLSPLILAGVDRLGRSGQWGQRDQWGAEIIIFLWWRLHWDNSPVEMRTVWDWHLGQQVNI